MDGEANSNLANLNAAHELSEHTVLKTAVTELQAASCRAGVVVFTLMVDVVDFALGCVSAAVAGEVLSDDGLRLTAEMSEIQVKYGRLAVELSSVSSECGTWRSMARERGDDTNRLLPLLNTSRDEFKLLESQVAAVQKKRGTCFLAGRMY